MADFWRYYGQGVDQLLALGVDVEDVADMAAHLPRESATMLALVPRQPAEAWDANTYLLAHLGDLLAGANWQRGGGKGRRPKPVQRPKAGPVEPVPDREAIDEFRAWYAAQPGGRTLTTE